MKHFVDVIQNDTSKIVFSTQNDQDKFELKEFSFELSKYFNISLIGSLTGYLNVPI